MNRYEISPPRSRAVFALAAVAMTVMTIGIAVVAPTQLHPGGPDPRTPGTASAVEPSRIEVVITPARIDVVADPVRETAFEPVRHAQPKGNQEG